MAAQARYYVSQDLHRLALKLHENLVEDYAGHGDPFTPARILVPNRNLKRWLFMRLSDPDVNPLGAAANLQFQFMEKGIEEMLRTLDKREDPGRLMTRRDSVLAVLSGLDRYETRFEAVEKRPDQTPDPMLEYLSAQADETPSGRAKRLYNLALRFASLFQEYEYHRHEWIDHWRARAKGRPQGIPPGREAVHDAEQRLYTMAYGDTIDKGLISFMPDSIRVFAEYAQSVLKQAGRRRQMAPVHVFGTAQISRFHVSMLAALSAYFPLRFYLLDLYPELGFAKSDWQALGPHGPFRKEEGGTSDFAGPSVPGAIHPLLSAWSVPARHTLSLLFENSPAKSRWFIDRPRATPSSVLGRLQQNILSGKGTLPGKADRSLQIAGCPSEKREIETIFHSILRNADENPQLRLTDIAVIVPDMKRYKPVIQSVFEGAATGRKAGLVIPYNLTDFSAGDESTFAEGAAALFDIIGSRFTRADLFRLFLNPCFLARWKLTRSDVMVWLDWAEKLHLYRGFAPSPPDAGPDSHQSRLYTWSLSSLRIRLGRIMDADAQFDNVVPYQDIASGDGDLLSSFCGVIEELHQAAEELLQIQRSNAEGLCGAFGSLLDRFLTDPPDRPEEGAVREDMRETLAWLERSAKQLDLRMSLILIREFLENGTTAISASRGTYLSGGVTISEMQPMRPLPFKVVYLCGLNESVFPGRSETSVLNLRAESPRTGDADKADMNRLLFLENLTSAREKLYLTYVSRDLERDREREPSSVIRELIQFCDGQGLSLHIHRIPLLTSDPRLFAPDASSDCDLFFSYSELDRQTALVRAGTEAEREGARTYLMEPRTFALSPPDTLMPLQRERIVAIEDLREFLLRPFDAVMRSLRLQEEEFDERVFQADEPLKAGYPHSYTLPADLIREGLFAKEWSAASGRQILAGLFAEGMKRGALPRGAFAQAQEETIAQDIIPVVSAMRMAAAGTPIRYVSFGEASAALLDGENRLPPVTLSVRLKNAGDVSVKLVSRGDFMAGPDFLVWTTRATPGDTDCLRPFLFHAALSLIDRSDPRLVTVFGSETSKPYRFQPVGEDDAKAYLTALAADFLNADTSFLPHSLLTRVPKIWEGPAASAVAKERYVRDLMAAFEDEFRPLSYTPMAKVLPALFPDDAYDIVRRRWKLFYDSLEKISEKRARKR